MKPDSGEMRTINQYPLIIEILVPYSIHLNRNSNCQHVDLNTTSRNSVKQNDAERCFFLLFSTLFLFHVQSPEGLLPVDFGFLQSSGIYTGTYKLAENAR